jgi:hypothetical protein
MSTFVTSFHASFSNKKKTIHEFDSKRKIQIVFLTKIRNIAFDIDTWFVKSLSFHFFCIKDCASETFFVTFSSTRSYSLMIEFDERKNDDSTSWFFSDVWTTYWWFRRQNVSRNVRIDDIKYREMCDMKTFQYVISKHFNIKSIRCETRKFDNCRMQRIL